VKEKQANTSVNLQEALEQQPSIAPGEVIIGSIVDIDSQGQVRVDYHTNPKKQPLIAVSTMGINRKHIGRQAALLFADGDPARPVIMGLIHSPLDEMLETYELTPVLETRMETMPRSNVTMDNVTINGKRIVLEGEEEIVLKCGDASITLTKAGKILIRGKYLLNRSTGVNRIMGGSVQVN